jgi:hypothetical protein
MDSRPNNDGKTALSAIALTAPQFQFPAEYTSLNFTLERQGTNPPPYSSFQQSFVRNYSLPCPAQNLTTDETSTYDCVKAAPKESWRLRVARLVTDWWLFEILSWVISALCMCAIALLLGLYDNHSLPSKWPSGISLNAAISVLSGIAKYTLAVPVEEALGQLKWIWFRNEESRKLIDLERFDDASRGPWGSFALIVHMRGRYVNQLPSCKVEPFLTKIRSLASLGGIIIVLSLALDPFFQQLTAYPKRPAMFGKSSLTRSVNFETQSTSVVVSGQKKTGGDYLVYPALEHAFLSRGAEVETPNPCPSNNCEWAPFDTLGICSQCEDVSDLLTFGCLAESGSWRNTGNYTIPPLDGPPPPPAQVTSCGWFINATGPEPMLMTGYTTTSNHSSKVPGEALWMRMINLHTPPLNHTYWNGSYRFKNTLDTLPIFDFMIAASPDVASVYADKPPQAAECVLRWCTKTISASVVDGNYTETVLSTFTNDTVQPNPFLDAWLRNRDLDAYTANISITPPGSRDTYSVSNKVVFQTIVPFSSFVPSYFTSDNISATPTVRQYEMAGVFTSQFQAIDTNRWVTPRNLSAYVENIATAMTNVIRTYPNSSEPVFGYGGLETYIHIQWGWFCLPLIVLFSTLFVLVATICKGSSQEQGGLWKTSTLAILLHGLDAKTRQDFGDSWSTHEMKAKAREMSVTLRPGLDGYRFHRVENRLEKV